MNPPTQPPVGQSPAPDNSPFKTDVVQNIPMQTQAPSEPPKEKDDVEMDLMMQDVGQALKNNVSRPAKHHFFSKKPKDSPIPQPPHQPVSAPPQSTASPPPPQSQVQHQNQSQPAPKAPTKPKTKHSVPIFIILVTIIITGALIVVAVAASKQQ